MTMPLTEHVRCRYRTENDSPKVIVFACKWCALIGADGAGKKRVQLPAHFRVIPVECASRVEPDSIIRAFSIGIDGVAVLGCHIGGCRYNNANHMAIKRLDLLNHLLDTVGIGSKRLLTSYGTAHEYYQFADILQAFFKEVEILSPIPKLK
jgi:F420-non-reducing hydrogenase iron-sulfur subunit